MSSSLLLLLLLQQVRLRLAWSLQPQALQTWAVEMWGLKRGALGWRLLLLHSTLYAEGLGAAVAAAAAAGAVDQRQRLLLWLLPWAVGAVRSACVCVVCVYVCVCVCVWMCLCVMLYACMCKSRTTPVRWISGFLSSLLFN